jgi:hypothetical protein
MPDNWNELIKLRQEMKDKYNPEFIDLLGEEKFMIYDVSRNSMQERNEVNRIMADMGPENRISDDVAEMLVQGMYEARRSAAKELDLIANENHSDSWNTFSLSMLETIIQTWKKYEEPVNNILPPDQAELFITSLRNMQKHYEETKRMISLVVEAEKNEDDTAEKSE